MLSVLPFVYYSYLFTVGDFVGVTVISSVGLTLGASDGKDIGEKVDAALGSALGPALGPVVANAIAMKVGLLIRGGAIVVDSEGATLRK